MKRWEGILISTILFAACKKPYNPPAIVAPGLYLVVEGVINAGADSTIIKLSHTVKLSSGSTLNPVFNAIVTVESDQNFVFPLAETTSGNYVSADLNLDNSHKYRLSIKINNEQYYSDFEPVLNSPPIDSLYYTIATNGINIYTNTHDPANTVKYYRWDYLEIWMIHPMYYSGFISNGDTVLLRALSQQVFLCSPADVSSTLILGSTAALVKDVIYNKPITSIPSTSDKIGNEYSILVRQYALTAGAYTFWSNLKTNTEQLGSIFDAEPSQINGNIHSSTNPAEQVVGYISVGSVSSQRIFIRNQQLPGWQQDNPYAYCALDTEYYVYYYKGDNYPINQVDQTINYNSNDFVKNRINPLIPIGPISGQPGQPPIGYSASTRLCADCTLQGTNVQPGYWKY